MQIVNVLQEFGCSGNGPLCIAVHWEVMNLYHMFTGHIGDDHLFPGFRDMGSLLFFSLEFSQYLQNVHIELVLDLKLVIRSSCCSSRVGEASQDLDS